MAAAERPSAPPAWRHSPRRPGGAGPGAWCAPCPRPFPGPAGSTPSAPTDRARRARWGRSGRGAPGGPTLPGGGRGLNPLELGQGGGEALGALEVRLRRDVLPGEEEAQVGGGGHRGDLPPEPPQGLLVDPRQEPPLAPLGLGLPRGEPALEDEALGLEHRQGRGHVGGRDPGGPGQRRRGDRPQGLEAPPEELDHRRVPVVGDAAEGRGQGEGRRDGRLGAAPPGPRRGARRRPTRAPAPRGPSPAPRPQARRSGPRAPRRGPPRRSGTRGASGRRGARLGSRGTGARRRRGPGRWPRRPGPRARRGPTDRRSAGG